MSIGAASSGGSPGPSPAELLARAGAHRYNAEREGRDLVVADV